MILEKADRLPPYVCRLLARTRNGWKPLSYHDIATASGLSLTAVKKLSHLSSWATVQVAVADQFAKACGVDLMQPAKLKKLLRKARLTHMERAGPQQRILFARLMAIKTGP